MAKKKYNNKDKARKFRAMRPAVGENYMYDFSQPSNSHSTHLGTTYEADGKFYVAPSITNNKAPYASSVYHPQSFREAMNAGEGIPFDTQEEASKFAEGSWKLPKYPRPNYKYGGPTDPPTGLAATYDLQPAMDYNINRLNNPFFQNRLRKEYSNAHGIDLTDQQMSDLVSGGIDMINTGGNTATYTEEGMANTSSRAAGFMRGDYSFHPFLGKIPSPVLGQISLRPGLDEDATKSVAKHEVGHRYNAALGTPFSSSTHSPLIDQSIAYNQSFFNKPYTQGAYRIENTEEGEIGSNRSRYYRSPHEIKSYKLQLEDEMQNQEVWNPMKSEFDQSNLRSLLGNEKVLSGSTTNVMTQGLGLNSLAEAYKDVDPYGFNANPFRSGAPAVSFEGNKFRDAQVPLLDSKGIPLNSGVTSSRGDIARKSVGSNVRDTHTILGGSKANPLTPGNAYEKNPDEYLYEGYSNLESNPYSSKSLGDFSVRDQKKYRGYASDIVKGSNKNFRNLFNKGMSYKDMKDEYFANAGNVVGLTQSINRLTGIESGNAYWNNEIKNNPEVQAAYERMSGINAETLDKYNVNYRQSNGKVGRVNPMANVSDQLSKRKYKKAVKQNARNIADFIKTGYKEQTGSSYKKDEKILMDAYNNVMKGYQQSSYRDMPALEGEIKDSYNKRKEFQGENWMDFVPDVDGVPAKDIGKNAIQFMNEVAMEDQSYNMAKYGGDMKKYKKGGPGSKMLPEVTVTPQMEALRNQGFDISDFPMVGFSKPEPYTGIAPDPSGMSIKQLLKLAKSFPAMMKYANKNYGSLAQIGDKVQDAYLNAKRIVDLGLSGYGKEKAALKEVDDLKDLMNQLDKAGDIIGPNRYKLMPDSKALKQGLDPDDPINLMRETLDEASFNKTLYEDALKLSKNPELKQYQIKELKKIADNSKVKLNNSNKELDNFLTGKYKSYEPLDDILLKAYTNPSAKGLQEFLPSNRNLQLNPLKQPRFQSQNKDLENLHNSFYGERITPGQSVILDQYVNPFKMNRYGGKNMKQYKKGGRPGLWDNIHAKRRRGEKMRKPGSEGAPTNEAFKNSQATYGGMLPEYGLGGFLKGALSGVAGSVPIVGGMMQNAIGVDPNDQSAQAGQMFGGIGSMLFNPMGGAGKAMNAFAEDGGEFMPEVDYEAEDGEVIVGDVKVNRAYNGGTMKSYKGGGMHLLSGPKHSEGGIGIMQFGGDSSYVFSNSMDLKVPKEFGKFNTFADAAKSRSKSLEDIAEMRMGGESYDRKTADLMEPLAMVEFENLFNAQEDFKEQNNIGNPTRTAQFGEEFEPNPALMGDAPSLGGSLFPAGYGESQGLNATYGNGMNLSGVSSPKLKEDKSKLPWQLYAANALPGAVNMAKGLFGTAPTLELEREEKQDYRNFQPLMDTYLRGQGRGLALGRAGLEGSGATGSQLRAGYQAMNSGAQSQMGQFMNQLSPQIEESRRATDTFNQGIMARNDQKTVMEDEFAMQNDPANSFSTGLGQIINAGTNLYMDNLKSKNIGTQMYGMFGDFLGGRNKGQRS